MSKPPICYLCKEPITDEGDIAYKQGFSEKHPFHEACFDKPFPDVPIDDGTPPIAQQAEKAGWSAAYYDFGLGNDGTRTFFNPCIVERPDGLWLLCRVSLQTNEPYGRNSVYAFMLDEAGKVPKMGIKLEWTDSVGDEHHEDPRACFYPELNQSVVCATNFKWHGYEASPVWTGALQVLGFFDEEWQCKVKHRPPIEFNPIVLSNVQVGHYEKSWVPFFHEGKLHIFYKPDPWVIFEFGHTWEEHKRHSAESPTWRYGIIRNGTSPVLVNGEYVSFFHSSLPWKFNLRRYYMGAVAFEAKPPFRPLRITPEPLLIGSQNDVWGQRKPPCVFPCGAVLREGTWLISAGINDLAAAWIEMPHESLLRRLEPTGSRVTPIFPTSGLSEQESRRERLRANLVKARAARSAKAARKAARREKRKNASIVRAEENLATK